MSTVCEKKVKTELKQILQETPRLYELKKEINFDNSEKGKY